jgi:hypothetical protein
VGKQLTLTAAPTPAQAALLGTLLSECDARRLALVARGTLAGLSRGFHTLGGGRFQSDRLSERFLLADLLATASTPTPLTFTAVPRGSERRIGCDRDADLALDRDELDRGFDPADASSHPRPPTRRR